MKRRDFLLASGVLGTAALRHAPAGESGSSPDRDIYELRRYHLASEQQKEGLDAFLRDAAIPAVNRLGIRPVGVFYFYPEQQSNPDQDHVLVYVLLCHPSLASATTLVSALAEDKVFLEKGAAFLEAPAESPAYKRIHSSLLVALAGMPRLETPTTATGRVMQLRIYESPSEQTGQKKIEMFNSAELAIFRRVGLHAVFFGETVIGADMPNLTYMLAFDSAEELKANWKKFSGDPEWQELRAMPEYADKRILSKITNRLLTPAAYSQI